MCTSKLSVWRAAENDTLCNIAAQEWFKYIRDMAGHGHHIDSPNVQGDLPTQPFVDASCMAADALSRMLNTHLQKIKVLAEAEPVFGPDELTISCLRRFDERRIDAKKVHPRELRGLTPPAQHEFKNLQEWYNFTREIATVLSAVLGIPPPSTLASAAPPPAASAPPPAAAAAPNASPAAGEAGELDAAQEASLENCFAEEVRRLSIPLSTIARSIGKSRMLAGAGKV